MHYLTMALARKSDAKASYHQLLVLVRPAGLCCGSAVSADQRMEQWGAGEAGGCAAVSLLLMLRESNAAPPRTSWMSGCGFSVKQKQPNPLIRAQPLLLRGATPNHYQLVNARGMFRLLNPLNLVKVELTLHLTAFC